MANDLGEVFKHITEDLVNVIKNNIQDSGKTSQMHAYKNQLGMLLSQIQSCLNQQNIISNKYASYITSAMTMYNNSEPSLDAINAAIQQDINYERRAQELIVQLFKLEHEIMSFLTDGLADTTDYTIYFASENGSGPILRGSFTAQDLYNFFDQNGWSIKNNAIQIQYKQAQELFLANKGNSNIAEISREAGSTLTNVLKEMLIEARTEYETLQAELEGLETAARKEHLGKERFRRWQSLSRIVGGSYSSDGKGGANVSIEATYRKFLMQGASVALAEALSQRGYKQNAINKLSMTTTRTPYGNRGHLVEAVERLIQDPSLSIEAAVQQSLGNLPWYFGGDVGTTQVKGIFESYVQLSSFNSLFSLAENIMLAMTNAELWISQADEAIKQKVTQDINSSNAVETADLKLREAAQYVVNKIV